jgi:hypothetical protein
MMHTRYKTHVMMIGAPNITCFSDTAITSTAKSSRWLSNYDDFAKPRRSNEDEADFTEIPPDAAASERQTPGFQRLTAMRTKFQKPQEKSAKSIIRVLDGTACAKSGCPARTASRFHDNPIQMSRLQCAK